MAHKIPLPVRITVGVIILAIVGLYAITMLQEGEDGPLIASGTVEALELNLSPEISGKVATSYVEEGMSISEGELLLSLDGQYLAAQRAVAAASLESAISARDNGQLAVELAEARYAAAYDKAQADARNLRTSELLQNDTPEYQQAEWYFDLDESLNSLLEEERAAIEDLNSTREEVTSIAQRVGASGFIEIERNLENKRIGYEVAKAVFDKLNVSGADLILVDTAKLNMDDAKLELESAERDYLDSLTTDGAADVLEARAKLHVAQQRLDTVQSKIMRFQTGDHSLELEMAEIGARQARAQLESVEKSIATAEANLALIDAQIAKLDIKSPISAVVQTKNVEIGEVVNPGTVVLSLLDLSNLTLTVFVTEDRYGEVSLNQKVEIKVDSFPEIIFEGQVTRIADQAEFTPRNVQTIDGRKTTVFAIKIHVTDPDGLIKPGMPADVVFLP